MIVKLKNTTNKIIIIEKKLKLINLFTKKIKKSYQPRVRGNSDSKKKQKKIFFNNNKTKNYNKN